MSLLLDALKRAEEAKRAKLLAERGESPASPAADARDRGVSAHQIIARTGMQPPALDSTELRIADYDEEMLAPKTPAAIDERDDDASASATKPAPVKAELSLEQLRIEPVVPIPGAVEPTIARQPAPPRPIASSDREVARNVFVAKQAAVDDRPEKKWLLPAIATGVVVVGAGGWYVWNEINRISRPGPAAVARTAPAPAQIAVPPPAPPQTTPGASTVPSVPATATSSGTVVAEAPLPPLLPPAIEPSPLEAVVPTPGAKAPVRLSERESLAKALKQIPQTSEPPVALKLARSMALAAVSAELTSAYQSLKDGNYALAVTRYSKLVQAEPLNIDAQLGLAAAHARKGDAPAAAKHYRAVLAIDPRNTSAIAGLMAVSRTGAESPEVELKGLISKFPTSAALHFALGNQLASERRWVEAQQSYFEAYRLDADRADHVYNLAVSLDQLGKQVLAKEYYAKALAMPADAGAQFDRAAIARRLRELASGGNP